MGKNLSEFFRKPKKKNCFGNSTDQCRQDKLNIGDKLGLRGELFRLSKEIKLINWSKTALIRVFVLCLCLSVSISVFSAVLYNFFTLLVFSVSREKYFFLGKCGGFFFSLPSLAFGVDSVDVEKSTMP